MGGWWRRRFSGHTPNEVVIRGRSPGVPGAMVTVTFRSFTDPYRDGYDWLKFDIVVDSAHVHAETEVSHHPHSGAPSLADFFETLAAEWPVSGRVRKWESLTPALVIEVSEGVLHFTVREEVSGSGWKLLASMKASGADVAQAARELREVAQLHDRHRKPPWTG